MVFTKHNNLWHPSGMRASKIVGRPVVSLRSTTG